MKAPDNIFLNRRHPEPYWFKDKQVDSDIEYIRKDTLLEWLEQNRNQSQMWFDRYHEKEDLSAKQVWEEVINKLNSI